MSIQRSRSFDRREIRNDKSFRNDLVRNSIEVEFLDG